MSPTALSPTILSPMVSPPPTPGGAEEEESGPVFHDLVLILDAPALPPPPRKLPNLPEEMDVRFGFGWFWLDFGMVRNGFVWFTIDEFEPQRSCEYGIIDAVGCPICGIV